MEDIALMRALPGMVVVNPCDYNQTMQATIAAAKYDGPVYLRFGRPSVPNFTDPEQPFEIGKAYVMNEGKDITVFCCGHLVWEALKAAEALEAEGIGVEVVNLATIKPLDEDAIVASVSKTGRAIVAEEHNMAGGLGEAVAGVLARLRPTPLVFMNGEDKFGQTGSPAALMELYGLDAAHIAAKVREIVK
jgi:transketolase